MFCERSGHVRQQSGPIQRLNLDVHQEHAGLCCSPDHRGHSIGLLGQVSHVRTAAAVHRNP